MRRANLGATTATISNATTAPIAIPRRSKLIAASPAENGAMWDRRPSLAVRPVGAIEGDAGSFRAAVAKRAVESQLSSRLVHPKHPNAALGDGPGLVDHDDVRGAVTRKPVGALTLVERHRRDHVNMLQIANVKSENAVVGSVRLDPVGAHDDGHGAPRRRLGVDQLDARVFAFESNDLIQLARARV